MEERPGDWDRLAHHARILRDLHAGVAVSPEFDSPAMRRRIAGLRITERLCQDRQAEASRRRAELETTLADIVARAPRVVPAPKPPRSTVFVPGTTPGASPPPSFWMPRRTAHDLEQFWSPTVVLGFRAWDVRRQVWGAKRPWLTPTYWAGCVAHGAEAFDDEVPHTDGRCGRPPCGIYATKAPEMLLEELESEANRTAFGLVALSGKVVEHTAGYRAAEARVLAVCVRQGNTVIEVAPEDLPGFFADPCELLDPLLEASPARQAGGPETGQVSATVTRHRDGGEARRAIARLLVSAYDRWAGEGLTA
ncbi:MAG: hypothetical protein QY307_06790 [Acidimicrobiia bacterium]|nr:MAG: hypothetical protein QY307_06790 [Acidimicrobiia bacterium]